MKEIPLTQGQVALVDDEDYEKLACYKWCAQWDEHTHSYYAIRKARVNGKRKTIRMHRIVVDAQPEQEVDHINHNALDNRRENLRACTHAENMRNQKRHIDGTSAFKGVYWDKESHRWQARIMLDKREHRIGYFNDEVDAARAYDLKAHEIFGEFALTNFSDHTKS